MPGSPPLKVKATLGDIEPGRRLTWHGNVGADWLFAGTRELLIERKSGSEVCGDGPGEGRTTALSRIDGLATAESCVQAPIGVTGIASASSPWPRGQPGPAAQTRRPHVPRRRARRQPGAARRARKSPAMSGALRFRFDWALLG
jgi:hypothetical protein